MKYWLLNQAALQGLYDEGLLTILCEVGSEVRELHPDIGLITTPQLMTVKVGQQVLDVVHTDIVEQTWELRPAGAL